MSRFFVTSALACACVAWTLPSFAQHQPIPEGVHKDPRAYDSPQNFALELRVGMYEPEVDSDTRLGGKHPYADSFGDKSRVMLGAELDWQVLKIPHVGTLGPGFGIATTGPRSPWVLNLTKLVNSSVRTQPLTPGWWKNP